MPARAAVEGDQVGGECGLREVCPSGFGGQIPLYDRTRFGLRVPAPRAGTSGAGTGPGSKRNALMSARRADRDRGSAISAACIMASCPAGVRLSRIR